MKTKQYMLIFAVGIFFISHVQVAEGRYKQVFPNFSSSQILNFEKTKRSVVFHSDFSTLFMQRARELVRLPFVYIENSKLADYSSKEPVMSGVLTLFVCVALGALGFIFHLIRHDSRFN